MDTRIEPPDAPALDPRVALLSIVGFWLFYFVIVTIRSALLGFDGQLEMMARRLGVAFASMAITGCFYLVLRRVSTRSLRRSIVIAALLTVPAAILYSTINYYAFAHESDHANSRKSTRKIEVFRQTGRSPGPPAVSAEGDRPQSPRSGHSSVPPAPPAPPAPPSVTRIVTVQVGDETAEDEEMTPAKMIADNSANGYFFFAAWAALYLALCYAAEVGLLERRSADLRTAAQSAELKALRYQVNPHFLFNTLNSLSSLVMTGKREEAERMIIGLSTFFRTSLTADPADDVTLEEEIRLQRLYLDIEAVRFPDRLKVEIDVPEDVRSACVPGMILQPLVENAIKHGVARSRRPVTLRIHARGEGDSLVIMVENDGDGDAGRERDAAPVEGTGVGLKNVRDRLAARFGDAGRSRWGTLPGGGFGVTLRMPIVRNGC